MEKTSGTSKSNSVEINGRKNKTAHPIMPLIPNIPGIGSPA